MACSCFGYVAVFRCLGGIDGIIFFVGHFFIFILFSSLAFLASVAFLAFVASVASAAFVAFVALPFFTCESIYLI